MLFLEICLLCANRLNFQVLLPYYFSGACFCRADCTVSIGTGHPHFRKPRGFKTRSLKTWSTAFLNCDVFKLRVRSDPSRSPACSAITGNLLFKSWSVWSCSFHDGSRVHIYNTAFVCGNSPYSWSWSWSRSFLATGLWSNRFSTCQRTTQALSNYCGLFSTEFGNHGACKLLGWV